MVRFTVDGAYDYDLNCYEAVYAGDQIAFFEVSLVDFTAGETLFGWALPRVLALP